MRSGFFRGDFVERNLVVAMHLQLPAQLAEKLREVIGERVVVVEKQNHRLQFMALDPRRRLL